MDFDIYQFFYAIKLLGAPNLQDNFLLKIQEGDFNVPVDLLLEPAAFPEPSTFEWRKNDQPLRQNGITTTYSSVTFDSIVQSDAGNYTVTATNFILDASQPVGSDAGSFSLDILCKCAQTTIIKVDWEMSSYNFI